MSELNYLDSLKSKNLWPQKSLEKWKYFDFQKFTQETNSIQQRTFLPKIIFVSSPKKFIKFTSAEVFVSENLKQILQINFIKINNLLNMESKLDFCMTSQNFENLATYILIEDQKSLDLNLIYENTNQEINFNPVIRFEIKNSEVTIFEQDNPDQIDSKGTSLSCIHTQTILSQSKLNHVIAYADLNLKNIKIINSEVLLDNKSNYKQTVFLIKNQFVRYQQSISLKSSECEAHLSAFNISDQKSFSEVRTEVLHLEPKTVSRQLFKTIVSDESQSVFNGRVFVDPKAQKTDSAQLCQGLILSAKAEINAKPELEIYADDVKASHGAAIGQMGKDQIFYLISRGIKPEQAYKILAYAFAGEVISKIESKQYKDKCQALLEQSSSALFDKMAENFRS